MKRTVTDHGFTLIETMTALAITATLFAIGTPAYLSAKNAAETSITKVHGNPQSCALEVFADYGLDIADIFLETPMPPEAQDRVIRECLMPHLMGMP